MNNYSTVYLREEGRSVRVLNGMDKPEISKTTVEKWQGIINLISEIFTVPASLIMRMTDSDMEIFLKSDGEENPYPPDGKDNLGHGLYCETVIGRNKMLHVENSLEEEKWKDNPDVKLNMIGYLGFPLHWPDGAVFGTICSLDSKNLPFNIQFQKLMKEFSRVIELDLQEQFELDILAGENRLKEKMLREIHHRIKNNFNIILGSIQLKYAFDQEDFSSLIKDIEHKIHAISTLHE